MLLLIDDGSPRYGGGSDPDEERERRWQPVDRRLLAPFLGSWSCLIASGAVQPDEPLLTYALTAGAIGLCGVAARRALRERP